jgi:hypothetical protein
VREAEREMKGRQNEQGEEILVDVMMQNLSGGTA